MMRSLVQGSNVESRGTNPYKHILGGLFTEILAFSAILVVLALVVVLARAIAG